MQIKKNSGFLLVSVFIVLSDIIFIFLNYDAALKTLDKDIQDWAQQTENLFKITLDAKATSMQQLATFIANDPRVGTLFKKGKDAVLSEGGGQGKKIASLTRKKLFELVKPGWGKMSDIYNLRQLHFHLGPGSTSFLRVHRPEKFGDNMDKVRYTVVDVNEELKPTKGFETGRVYSGIRGVVPVFDRNGSDKKDEHIGALEVGTSFTILLKSLKNELESDICVLLTKEHIQKNMWPDFVNSHFTPDLRLADFFIEATTNSKIKKILSIKKVFSLMNSEGSAFIKGDFPLQVCVFPLRDYESTINMSLPKSGNIIVWKDASKRWKVFRKTLFNNILYAVLVLLLVETILFITWKFSKEKLQTIIKIKTKEISENHKKLDVLIKNLPTGILVVDTISNKIIDINPQAAKMIGDLAKNLVGHRYTDLLIENTSQIKFENNKHTNQEGPLDCRLLAFNGNEIPVLKTEINAIIHDREVLILSLSDLTKHKEAEGERIQREKLQSILEMAGAICHELNQPLMAISGYSELLLLDTPKKAQQNENIRIIQKQVDRLGTITRKLMNITQYKTKKYLKRKIIDIDAASDEKENKE